jgi:hypothetical protein
VHLPVLENGSLTKSKMSGIIKRQVVAIGFNVRYPTNVTLALTNDVGFNDWGPKSSWGLGAGKIAK